ncbi:MAG TPA: shikimate kinase, partial [Spirochaetota bacterium]|nr:shikimate kinase [Spirochaetota bacterium]
MKIIITGPKGSGKSTMGKDIAAKFTIPFVETDEILEELYSDHTGLSRTCREIVQKEGETIFREWEGEAVKEAARLDWCIIATGGGTMGNPSYREAL